MEKKQLSRLNPGLGLHPNDISDIQDDLKGPIDEKGTQLTRKQRRYIMRTAPKNLKKFEARKKKK